MGLGRETMKTVVAIAGTVSLVASTCWALSAEIRTDIPPGADDTTFEGASTDTNGSTIEAADYSVYAGYEGENYGYVYKTVTTVNGKVSVAAEFELQNPDQVSIIGPQATGSEIMKQSNQLYVEELTLHSPGGPNGTVTAPTGKVDGCKGRISLDTPSSAHSFLYTFASGVAKCNDAGLSALVPSSSARTVIQDIIGRKADGTGLKLKNEHLPNDSF